MANKELLKSIFAKEEYLYKFSSRYPGSGTKLHKKYKVQLTPDRFVN